MAHSGALELKLNASACVCVCVGVCVGVHEHVRECVSLPVWLLNKAKH